MPLVPGRTVALAVKADASGMVNLHNISGSHDIERVRKASGKSRSAVVQDALRHWLDSQAHAALVREYEAGYRRKPEGRREIKAAEAAAVRLLSTQDW
jgi:Arc/MetJ-type ribon-helix-helix transcriptional regulator